MPLKEFDKDILNLYKTNKHIELSSPDERADKAFNVTKYIISNKNKDITINDCKDIISSFFDTVSQNGRDIENECGSREWKYQTNYLMLKLVNSKLIMNDEIVCIKDIPKESLYTLLHVYLIEKISGYHVSFVMHLIPTILSNIT